MLRSHTNRLLRAVENMFTLRRLSSGSDTGCAGACRTAPVLFLLTLVFSASVQAGKFTDLAPVSPQPAAEQVKPGLAVDYLFEKFYTLSDLYEASVEPEKGEPIPHLNALTETDSATGEDKILNVLTTDQDMMVGAFIRGLIHFSEAGNYVLHLVSNDGVRFWVGGVQIWEDPEVHFDRESDPLELDITTPGWYELKIDYYQKKGTHALQLLWTPPGGEKTVVPPEALGHLE